MSLAPRPGPLRHLASDNYAGICPEAWAAMAEANLDHAPGYGEDRWTAEAADLLREVFETDCEVFFVFNGTAANSLALASLCQSYHSILCHEVAHVETDECGAPEFFSNGTKVLTVSGHHGKIVPDQIDHMVKRRDDVHYPKPRVVSVTQATELGTVYTPAELKAIWARTKSHGLRLHMDGARFANAVASLSVAPKEITWQAGVDVLCLGGTKAGLAVGEAVVFFDRALAAEFDYRCKQAGQLASKMRFLAAPLVGMLRGGAWLAHARHANEMAALLVSCVVGVVGLELAPSRASRSCTRARRTRSSCRSRAGSPTPCARGAGASTTSSEAGRGSCAPGTRAPRTSRPSRRTSPPPPADGAPGGRRSFAAGELGRPRLAESPVTYSPIVKVIRQETLGSHPRRRCGPARRCAGRDRRPHRWKAPRIRAAAQAPLAAG